MSKYQDSISYGELAELTHATQVAKFNWCNCEEQEQFPYMDCPGRTLSILKAEYERAKDYPLFNDPADYCILLDLIQDKIDMLEVAS